MDVTLAAITPRSANLRRLDQSGLGYTFPGRHLFPFQQLNLLTTTAGWGLSMAVVARFLTLWLVAIIGVGIEVIRECVYVFRGIL